MKVVHIANYFLPEFGYQEHYLAKKHAELGNEVHVITSDKAYPNHQEYKAFSLYYPSRELSPGTQKGDGYVVHRLPITAEKNMQLFLKGLFDELVRLKPDLVIMHGLTRYETVRLCLWKKYRGLNFKLLVDDHSLYAGYHPKFYRNVYHWGIRTLFGVGGLLQVVDRIIPVSQETSRLLHEHFGIPVSRMTVLPIGADCQRFTFSAEGRASVRKKLGIPSDGLVLSYVGKIVQERGVGLAYDVALEELKTHKNFYFMLVGSGDRGDFANSIRDRAQKDGVESQVVFHGNVPHDQLRDYYSAADIAIWTLQETMAALEASSCGLPLILGNSEIARERLGGGNGINCKSPEEMKQALKLLLSDPELRKSMGARGAKFIRENFDWTQIALKFLEAGSAT